MRGAADRHDRDVTAMKWQAWHVAALQRAKHMPALADFLSAAPKRQTPEQIAAQFYALAGVMRAKRIGPDREKQG
jgi:hypothetical protein